MGETGIDRVRDLFTLKLNEIEKLGRLRSLRPLSFSETPLLDLTHNDYLGFRYDDAFQTAVREAAVPWPLGAGASRLLGAEHKVYGELEKVFSAWKGAEASLYFSSGYAANEAVLSALAHPEIEFFSDSLNHASIIDGLKLAKIESKQKIIFRHNDLEDLRDKLQASKAKGKVIVTESLFSMDGDVAPLAKILDLCREFKALLVVDEAHALGLFGNEGAGLLSGFDHSEIISINPCGKAMAASGALVSGPEWLRRLLINTGRSFIYSTGASPWVAAGLIAAIEFVRKAKVKRVRLQMLGNSLRDSLEELGLDFGDSSTHIIPLILGTESKSLHLEKALAERGILARAIRPPTVPEHECRLRLSLHANISSLEPLTLALKDLT